ncbi:MAG: nucleotidyl transferase AbiEii/AbiGii toxin family protein [Tissierellaceae bacterium]
MDYKEKILYKIMGNLYSNSAPLIFKGALVTKLILFENLFDEISRNTADIDASWIEGAPSMDYLASLIKDSLGDLESRYDVTITREYTERQSAGIALVNKETGRIEITLDIEIKSEKMFQLYSYGDVEFRGVLADSIMADKISVLSTNTIFRRVKDLIDIYALSSCINFEMKLIIEQIRESNRVLGNFDAFLNRKDELEFAYNKLKRIIGKPKFEEIYNHINIFSHPFIINQDYNYQWNKDLTKWDKPQNIKENIGTDEWEPEL